LQANDCTTNKQMQTRRDVFQAIADPTRRAILILLASHAMTPNAVAEHFNSSRQAISNHIKILTECELVRQEQKGREIYYHLNATKINEIDKWVEQLKKIFETQFNQLDNVLSTLKNPAYAKASADKNRKK
jgi:DNA-binding transcriptional ArsR family regulator